MESSPFLQPISIGSPASSLAGKLKTRIPFIPQFHRQLWQPIFRPPAPALSAVKSPRGFGTPPEKLRRNQKKNKKSYSDDEDDEDDLDADRDDVTIPEVVTNRMMKRMAFSVGIPLAFGLLFFPFFYYLKVVQKVDVPTWVPFIVSFFFFGSALLGVSYGIVSSSWDPLREGSLLGWNEAQRNWPVFWQSLWGGKDKK